MIICNKKEDKYIAKKRVNGEGSITKRAEGRYLGKIMIGRKPNGSPNRISVYGKSEKEVSIKLRELATQADKGSYVLPNKLTLGEWLKRWLKDYKSIDLKPRTYDTVESHITNHIIPELGDIELKNLKAPQIQQFYNLKYSNGEGLSSATIRKIHNIINAALKQALFNELLIKNPASGVKLPALEQKPIKAFTEEEHARFFQAAKKADIHNALMLADVTGVRLCELLPLNWDDIDLKEGQIIINKTLSLVRDRKGTSGKKYILIVQKPKTKASIRKIPLTQRAQKMLMEMKLKNSLKNDLIFPSRNGTYINPRNFERSFQTIVKNAGIEKCNTHTIRHTFATRCFEKGIPVKIISIWLGHSKVAHTLDIYTHVMPDTEKSAIQILESSTNTGLKSIELQPNSQPN